MKAFSLVLTFFLLILTVSASIAATDTFYTLTSTTASWDGTSGNRHLPKTVDYNYTYGDDESITYKLPWGFTFYGQTFDQITVDTNGNVWFGVSGSAKSFSLANNERGSVISAWNNDLSSYYYGGVYIQRKSSPSERVVIEWQTETYTREGLLQPNQFEIVLYPNGSIRFDYKSFTADTANKDFGSGISFNDGKFFINLTTDSGSVFGLADRSYLATVTGAVKTLDIAFDGTGTGAVSSNHPVSWTASKPAFFPTGAQITLQPMTDSGANIFEGWSGPCNGKGTCTVQLNENTVVTARFTRSNVWIDGKWGYTGLQEAYNAAVDGDVIKAQALTFAEDLNFNRPISVGLDGGYNFDFNDRVGITTLTGMMSAADGVSNVGSFQVGAGEPSPSTFFTIDATSTLGGSITPLGRLTLTPGINYTFKMYTHTGYKLVDVKVDGVSVGTPGAFTFSNITANHTIKAFYVARLFIAKSGDGSVTVTSAPAVISCGSTCFADFVPGTTVVLAAAPDGYTAFTGWSGGGCSGTATCTLTMNADTTVMASYKASHARIVAAPPKDFDTIQAAYDVAGDGATILVRDLTIQEDLSANAAKKITINGGYDVNYAVGTGITVLKGSLTIVTGEVTINGFALQE